MSTQNHSAFSPHPSIHPAAQPFLLTGGPVGILFVHGFGGSIGDYRSLAEDFHKQGFTAAGLCLAGHGQTPEALGQTDMLDWRESVFLAGRELKNHCQQIILIGGSLGGALAVDYAIHAPERIMGLVTINTGLSYQGAGRFQKVALKTIGLFKKNYPKKFATPGDREKTVAVGSLLEWPINGILENYRFLETFIRPGLPRLKTPLLVLVNPKDPVINVASARQLHERAGSQTKKIQELAGAVHNPLRSPEVRAEVLAKTQAFIRSLEA